VHERCVNARAPGTPSPLARHRLVEQILGADVLEREPAARFDLAHLCGSEQRAERTDDPVRVGGHLTQRVDTLHLRRQQVVARPTVDAGVPGDAELGEQPDGELTDLGQQRPRGIRHRQAAVEQPTVHRPVLTDVRSRLPGLGRQRRRRHLPRARPGALCRSK
jgi:hypothetical protein